MAAATTMISCKGEDGDPGPAGVMGTDGKDGQNGRDGNANVKSYTTTLSASDWLFFSNDLSYVDLKVPIVTDQIAATGMVMVYLQEANGEWYALPFTRGTQSYFFWVKSGSVRIHTQNSGTSPNKFIGKIRVVAVSADGRICNPNINWTDYNSVKAGLDLPD